MKLWRKCALLCLLALLAMTAGAAAFEDGEHRMELSVFELPELECLEDTAPDADAALLAAPDYEGAFEALQKGIWNGDTSIDIYAYNIPFSGEEMARLGNGIKYEPGMFGVVGFDGATGRDGVFATIRPKYTIAGDDYAEAKQVYLDGLNEIVEQVDPSWSELEQVLFVHDYLASHFQYDMRLYDPDVDINDLIYDSYRFFAYGVGVCEAYAKTFLAVARELGLQVSYVESMLLNHVWNLVEIDGKWYHLDVTHDDPVTDRLGYARHLYFLQSDGAAIAQRKESWEEKHPGEEWTVDWVYGNGEACTDTTYDNYCWRSAVSPFLYVDGVWYAVTEEGLKTWDGASPDFEETVDGFASPSSGLSLHCGRLYYNGYYEVRCYEPFTGRIFLVRDFARAHGAGHYGQGLAVEGDTLTYEVYWFDEDDVYHYGRGNCPLESYLKAAEDGSFGYYVSNGRLYLQADTDQVAVAFYNDKGRMTGVSLLTGESSCALRKGQVKLMAMTANGWLPCEKTLDGTVL